MNLTVSVTNRCNSRCKTCRIHQKANTRELALGEWDRTSRAIGKDVFWITFSGGEPFLRNDLAELVCLFYTSCRPSIINIPTNGLLTDHIPDVVERIAVFCTEARIVVNLSIDDVGRKHDRIRGVAGNYERVLETYRRLKRLTLGNLSVGIHTVISRFNVGNFKDIYQTITGLHCDSYITEIAEERAELDTIGSDIAPKYEEYSNAIDFLVKEARASNSKGMGVVTRAFRTEYYEMAKAMIREQRQIIPCYAGFASAQIASDGEVWMCCTKADSVGNLRDVSYDFRRVWFSEKARQLRQGIKRGECHCTLANVAYTNMLLNSRMLARVGCRYLCRFW